MSDRTDLTRWNRSELSRFTYVDGNAVEYLELLRQQLAKQFNDAGWINPAEAVPDNELPVDGEPLLEVQKRRHVRAQRLVQMYRQDRQDWAWEISRTFARACHVLTGYSDAWANEGYLGTATQWDNVRRLVELLGYYPAPPVSATTPLVLMAKDGMSGMVEKGFQVKNSPPKGGDKVIFETLDDLFIDSAQNSLQVAGWNQPEEEDIRYIWRSKGKPGVSPDDIALIVNSAMNKADAAVVKGINETTGVVLRSESGQEHWETWPVNEVEIHVSPSWQSKCSLSGPGLLHTREAHGFKAGAYIAWKPDNNEEADWEYAKVAEADNKSLALEDNASDPSEGDILYQLAPIKDVKFSSGSEVVAYIDANGAPATDIPAIDERNPTVSEPPGNLISIDDIFTIIKPTSESSAGGSGGAMLPPASLPKIGSFLFPSPMLPMDLVKAAVELMLSLGVMQIPSSGEYVIKGLPLGELLGGIEIPAGSSIGGALFSLLAGLKDGDDNPLVQWGASYLTGGAPDVTKIVNDLNTRLTTNPAVLTALFQEVTEAGEHDLSDPSDSTLKGKLLTVPKSEAYREAFRKGVVTGNSQSYLFNGTPDRIKESGWIAARFGDDAYKALKIITISRMSEPDLFALSFKYLDASGELKDLPGGEDLKEIYAGFRGELVAEKVEINNSLIETDEVELVRLPDRFRVGQYILLAAAGREAVLARIVRIIGNSIVTDPPIGDLGFTRGELVIYGNVVLSGHGVGKPARILGSGSAAKSNQAFMLEVEGVSFVPDETMGSGAAAAIDVIVDGRIWEQVSTLMDSAADDHHYAVRMTEERYISIFFGDGINGRRLPTDRNNVLVRYREGTGLAGNLPVGSLEKIVNQHPLVDSVLQPARSVGGGDMEDISSLRENAPKSLLALERAVSISDFVALATSRTNIWQASAAVEITNATQMEKVRVTIVPADGVRSPRAEEDVRKFLQSHALPAVQVMVGNFDPIIDFDVEITVRVDINAFLPEVVVSDVTDAIKEYFKLKNRKLGAPLFLSEVYKVVEGVQGVENSVCRLKMRGEDLQLIPAANVRAVVYLDPNRLRVDYEEYAL